MGKMINLVSMLVFIDLFFLVTGQLCVEGVCSISSIVFGAILDPNTILDLGIFTFLIGTIQSLLSSPTGIASLLGGATVATVFVGSSIFRGIDTILFITIGLTLAGLASDFIFLFVNLSQLNFVLAAMTILPIIIIYIFSIVEWMRLKD